MGLTDEDGLSDLVDNMCSVKKKEGRWVARYDITREDKDSPLSLERQEGVGECHNECLTMQRACGAALKGNEDTLASLLASGASAKELKKKMCKKLCAKKAPKLGK